jgi:multiple sugar transport system ATP-binding protein
MADVDLIHLWKTYNEKAGPIVRNLSLTIEDGELISLLGPSGCGKTTTLRMIAGLEFPDAGEIIIGDQNVVSLPAKDRDIALVFQQYALYPHMSVRQNLEYPLKIQKISKEEMTKRVDDAAKLLDLSGKMDRKPGELSGGEQQRVALGRAIVRRPKVFLMDEPLSNLDAILRVQMRSHLKALQRETGVTTVVVTHDQSEAMSMSDRIAVMNQGIIQQIGDPDHIYQHPANTFVAGFIGDPPMNLMPGERTADGIVVDENWLIPAPANLPQGPVTVGARPETIKLSVEQKVGWHPMTVYISEPQGPDTIVNLRLGEQFIRVVTEPDVRPGPGETVWVNVERGGLRLFDATTGQAI